MRRNPAYSTKRGRIKAKSAPNRRWSWLFSAAPITGRTKEKYLDAMREWASRNGVRIHRLGMHRGYLVAFLTSSTKAIPKRHVVRVVGRKGSKLKLVGVPTTPKAASAAYSSKYHRKESTMPRTKKTAKRKTRKTKRATQVSKVTATKVGKTKGARPLKKGYFRGTGRNGNGYAVGKFFKSAK